MKKLMFLFCMLASFIACSDDKNDDPAKPEMPITDLRLPSVNPVAGDNVTIAGKGFAQDCKLQLKPEGAGTAVDATIVEVTDAGITFKTPTELTGKCKVILLQGGKSYELGDLIFDEAPDVEATLYGVFADETTTSVCPIDVTTQRRGKALFTLDSDMIEGIVADNHGVVYYKAITFVNNKDTYELRYYDIKAGKGGKIDWAEAPRCFSISTDGEKLYALTYDTDSYDIRLYSVGRNGDAELLNTYSDQLDASYSRLYSTGGTFLYGENYIFVGLRLDMGEEVYHISIVADLAEDYYDCFGADMVKSFHFVKTNDSHYVFKNNEGEDDTAQTTVHKFTGEDEWYGDDYNNPVIATIENDFVDQVYDATTGLIYGMFGGEGEGILPFDPKTDKALDPWMGSGCTALLYIKAWE